MTERLPPAVTGEDMRLDAVIARLDRIAALLTPAPAAGAPADGETIELKEPAEKPPKRAK